MNQPKQISTPWAEEGLKNNIPSRRDVGLSQESATYQEGFPSITMTPISVGGKPPSGRDMNGILYELSSHIAFTNRGKHYKFNQEFCDEINGYPKGAVLINDQETAFYISLVEQNKTNFNTNPDDNWLVIADTKFQAELEKRASKNSPAFTGTPTAPTAPQSTNNGQIATTEFVKTAIAALVGSAPTELDTLEELAAMLAENGDLRRTLLQKIGEKAPLSHKHPASDIEGLQEALDEAGKKGLPVGAVVAFPRAVTNPVGFLKCDGTTFTQSLYPDLYRVLGNQNKLPNLTRSDVGMTAYFATDNIPAGWIAFDQIRTQVTQSDYPELYRYLVAKYGSIEAVPLAEDRFLRNAHGDLTVGQIQEDEIKRHTHAVPVDNWGWSDRDNNPSIDYKSFIQTPKVHDILSYDSADNDNGYVSVKLTSPMATGGDESRPKSLILKLCIKAKNNLDDVQFWVKAFGSVDNQGVMDASKIAISLQAKANLGHLHTPDEISGLQQYIAGLIGADFAQSLTDNGWQRLPNGLILQWGKVNKGWSSSTDKRIIFPIAFPQQCLFVGLTEFTQDWTYATSIQARNKLTNSYVDIVSQRNDTNFFAIGY